MDDAEQVDGAPRAFEGSEVTPAAVGGVRRRRAFIGLAAVAAVALVSGVVGSGGSGGSSGDVSTDARGRPDDAAAAAAVAQHDGDAPRGRDRVVATVTTTTALAVTTTLVGIVQAQGGHEHDVDAGDAHHGAAVTTSSMSGHHGPTSTTSTTAGPTPTTVLIPGLPWQLGATAGEVAYTEDLVRRTQAAVASVPSIAAAEAMGYVRINADHLLKPKLVGDDKNLDPTAIESYIVSTRDGVDYISGGMYVLTLGTTMAEVPDVGPLVTWHDHGGFCFNASAVIVGTDPITGECPPSTVFIADPPMTHIWSQPLSNPDGSARTEAACGTFVYIDLPHDRAVPGCGSPLDPHHH